MERDSNDDGSAEATGSGLGCFFGVMMWCIPITAAVWLSWESEKITWWRGCIFAVAMLLAGGWVTPPVTTLVTLGLFKLFASPSGRLPLVITLLAGLLGTAAIVLTIAITGFLAYVLPMWAFIVLSVASSWLLPMIGLALLPDSREPSWKR